MGCHLKECAQATRCNPSCRFWHNQGNTCTACLTTSIPESTNPNKFLYETDTALFTCWTHSVVPLTLLEHVGLLEQLRHACQLIKADIYLIIWGHALNDWIAACPYWISSTYFHTVVNVPTTHYFSTPQLCTLHVKDLAIIQFQPADGIMLDNVAQAEDKTLSSQRSGIHLALSSHNQGTKHLNGTP